jgi:hypothetical protein
MLSNAEIATSLAELGQAIVKKIQLTELRGTDGGGHDAEYGCHYLITESCNIFLPAGRSDVNGYVQFSKIMGINGEITIQSVNDNLIKMGVISDTVLVYDVSQPITLFWQADNQIWVV